MHINDQPIKALIDTGSTVSLIERNRVTGILNDTNNCVIMNTIGFGSLNFYSDDLQEFSLADKPYMHKFHVVESLGSQEVPIIIGFDLISELKLTIYAGEPPRVYVDQVEIPASTNHAHSYQINVIHIEQDNPVFVSLIVDLYLMANSTMNIKLQVPEKRCNPGDIVEVVPLESFTELIYPNVISEIDDNYHISLTLFHYSKAPIILSKGRLQISHKLN